MALKTSKRQEWVAQSEIRNMTLECDRLGGVNLAQGVCDLDVPESVQHGAQQAIAHGYNIYTRYDGLKEIREAIAWKQKRFTGLDVDPEGEIVVSAGATGAFYCACLALLDPGDEVMVFEPYYGYHITTLKATGAVPVYLPLSAPDWAFTEQDLERVVTPRTRGILVNTPANPSGKVFSRPDLERIARFAEKHDLFVFTDEIYEYFVYDGLQHLAPAALAGMKERTITISGLSKTFSVTGWRIGYCICARKWAQTIGYFNDLVYVCAPAPLQMGVARGLIELDSDYYRAISEDYRKKRDRLCEALSAVDLPPIIPQGAYYILADISRLPGKNGKDRAMHLLRETGVACVPGQAFYHDQAGDHLARFCFAKRDPDLEDACRRLQQLGR